MSETPDLFPGKPLNPEDFTREQLVAALECVHNLAADYALGAYRGEMSEDDTEATYQAMLLSFPDIRRESLAYLAPLEFPMEDWRYDVSNGDTRLGYEEWLEHQVESKL